MGHWLTYTKPRSYLMDNKLQGEQVIVGINPWCKSMTGSVCILEARQSTSHAWCRTYWSVQSNTVPSNLTSTDENVELLKLATEYFPAILYIRMWKGWLFHLYTKWKHDNDFCKSKVHAWRHWNLWLSSFTPCQACKDFVHDINTFLFKWFPQHSPICQGSHTH